MESKQREKQTSPAFSGNVPAITGASMPRDKYNESSFFIAFFFFKKHNN